MKDILRTQAEIQHTFSMRKGDYPPTQFNFRTNKKAVMNFILENAYFLAQEIDEILIEIAGSRDAVKPWHEDHTGLSERKYISNSRIKEEACDVLAFAMNIALAAGLTPDNIEEEMAKVHDKVKKRQGA